jgi:uroporphyrinogen III methyltransferase/synthase
MQAAHVQSLTGFRILITRSKNENLILSEKLRALGAVTVELPTIEVVPPEDTDNLDRHIETLSTYDWVIFTSAHGVRLFAKRVIELGCSITGLRNLKIAAIGPATAAALESTCREPDYMPQEFLSEEIARGLGDVNGKRILLPRADIASPRLPEVLRKAGANVDEVVVYRTTAPQDLSSSSLQTILRGGIDVVTFTSPSTVRNLASVAGSSGLERPLKNVKVACIGPVTADAAKALGLHVDVVATNHTVEGLVEAIVNEVRTV